MTHTTNTPTNSNADELTARLKRIYALCDVSNNRVDPLIESQFIAEVHDAFKEAGYLPKEAQQEAYYKGVMFAVEHKQSVELVEELEKAAHYFSDKGLKLASETLRKLGLESKDNG